MKSPCTCEMKHNRRGSSSQCVEGTLGTYLADVWPAQKRPHCYDDQSNFFLVDILELGPEHAKDTDENLQIGNKHQNKK